MPGFESLLIPYNAILFLLLVGTSRLVPRLSSLAVERVTDPVLSVRVANLVRLRLENRGDLPVRARVRDEAPAGYVVDRREFSVSLSPGEQAELRYHVTPPQRGIAFFPGTFVEFRAPLGLAVVRHRLPTEARVDVYPDVLALREFDLLRQRGRLDRMGIRRSRRKGLSTEFESLREYRPGDDYRRIDWKSTARRGKLVVREFEQERSQPVIVCLDCGRGMLGEVEGTSKLDHVLNAALLLLHAAASRNDLIGLLAFSDIVRCYLPPERGRDRVRAVLRAVHDLEAEPVETNFVRAFSYLSARWKRRSLLVVMTDADEAEGAGALAEVLRPLRSRHLVYVVRVGDPRIRELVAREPCEVEDLYKKAGAIWYISQRKRADGALKSAGLQTLEAEPDELASALVGAYWEVKEAARL